MMGRNASSPSAGVKSIFFIMCVKIIERLEKLNLNKRCFTSFILGRRSISGWWLRWWKKMQLRYGGGGGNGN